MCVLTDMLLCISFQVSVLIFAFSDVFTGGYVSVTASALALAKTSNSLKMLDDVQQVAVFHVIRRGESCPLEVVDTDT